ncbi:hypothetical protein H9Y04_40660 [Streptomyces sp. TRM66268-LWL]|uniref:LemA family protein n=1 Tax=Streptomyces polyasparticus TaxID=2767826 RepID=A0ABR7SVH0_9ACTN|nr:hypothetical protein [Streptomyces polyasparticus]MBC9718859.1 hypothetical protein [Streptomyces polyasparticus]
MLPHWVQTAAFVAACSLVVCGVTVWANLHLARHRARLENARWESERLRACLMHLIEAASAANRYLAALHTIDPTDFGQRKEQVMAVLAAVSRAEAELAAAHRPPGAERAFAAVEHALDVLGELITAPKAVLPPAPDADPDAREQPLSPVMSSFADAYRTHAWAIWDDGEPVRKGIAAAARLARRPLDTLATRHPRSAASSASTAHDT